MQSSLNRLYSIFCLTADILPSTASCFLVVLKNSFWGVLKIRHSNNQKNLLKQISSNRDFLF